MHVMWPQVGLMSAAAAVRGCVAGQSNTAAQAASLARAVL
jgi:hypothetical protein